FPLNDHAIAEFRSAFRRVFSGDPQQYAVYRDVSKGITPAGIEFYLPLFFSKTETFFDYVPPDSTFVLDSYVRETIEKLNIEAADRYATARLDKERPVLEPKDLYCSSTEVFEELQRYPTIKVLPVSGTQAAANDFQTARVPEFVVKPRAEEPYHAFWEFINGFEGRILIVTESPGRRENLVGLFREHSIALSVYTHWQGFLADTSKRFGVAVAKLVKGFVVQDRNLAVLTESDIYGEKVLQRRQRSSSSLDPESVIKTLAELNAGDPIVHVEHGVGRYRGLQTLSIEGTPTEFLTIEYYGGDKLYVPILSLDIVSRYVGADSDTAPWHRLGSDAWIKAKQKARERAYDVAVELLEMQALRNARDGVAFPSGDDSYHAFAASFPFEETPDQRQAIDEVLSDMESSKPMDRLICGDVGFGKTEIAMRAAFVAVHGGAQVALLVPTTLLAQQHYQNFTDRFAELAVRIELMSRFRSAKQLTETARQLDNGNIDIIIGTHRLLQRDVKFKNLGLLIIDEEHRFGVRQKERLKRIRSQVDVLALTATPIPRTLNIALSGLRDISIIATPPRSRLSIKTFVREWNNPLIREAVLREGRRGGQIYFLHNEVRTIEKVRARLAEIVPEVGIRIAHGQMPEKQLEEVMRDFYHQRFHLLLCTTIIESGIDIPSANTIFINRADRFGLAQLHQLRGRVGRSHHQAYAYLLAPANTILTGDAAKRLRAIESLEDLGVGFALASHDLEIRGAGELLGESQSGLIDEIGFTMYTEYLNQAVSALRQQRGERPVKENANPPHTEINLNVAALLPETYMPDVHLRLTIYKRLASVGNISQLNDLKAEVIDRFGLLPEPGLNLFKITELRLKVGSLDVRRIDLGKSGGQFRFTENPNIDPGKILQLIASDPATYRMKDTHTLALRADLPDLEARLESAEGVLNNIMNPL
ncbi:MAG: transcription-repair coupling factor, partial [Gammaproteobacteria bacterium]|nr:transcription-repair coupling factor [Gammaproteobacteria bacterium]